MKLHAPRIAPPPERTGFFAGSSTHGRWLLWLLWGLVALNVLDAAFTLLWVRAGVATEANLLIRKLVTEHTVLFVATKIALVSLGALLLWRCRRNPMAVVGVFGAFLAYYWVLLQHLEFASWLVGRLGRS